VGVQQRTRDIDRQASSTPRDIELGEPEGNPFLTGSDDNVVPVATGVADVVGATRFDDFTLPGGDQVIVIGPSTAGHDLVAGAAIEVVGAGTADEFVRPDASCEGVGARAAVGDREDARVVVREGQVATQAGPVAENHVHLRDVEEMVDVVEIDVDFVDAADHLIRDGHSVVAGRSGHDSDRSSGQCDPRRQ